MGAADDVALVDHHCHGLLDSDLSGSEFRLLATEADVLSDSGTETLDHQFGLGIRAFCAPALGLPAHASIENYLERRREIGAAKVNDALLAATNSEMLLIDSGFTASPVLLPEAMQARFGVPTREICRLERIAEELAPTTTPSRFAEDFRSALAEAGRSAVGFKSVIAYRFGFDIEDHPPTADEVRAAAESWLAAAEKTGSFRVTHPVILQFLLWEATTHKKPIQMHTGYGDSDIQLFRADPSRATRFFLATQNSGARFTLLHCYPFVREAAILSQVFPHVYCDVGVTGHYLGPSAITAIRHALEIAPFNKILYSSDAYGLAEHYFVSALNWRRSLGVVLDEWIEGDWLDSLGADHIVGLIAAGNARRIYELEPSE